MANIPSNCIYTDRRDAFVGRAKIRIAHLRYENNSIHGTRALDLSNVARLRRIYELEGCQRLEPDHYIAALINHHTLNRALELSHLELEALRPRDYDVLATLELGEADFVTCLYGKHRLEAAKAFLDPTDKWWVVDIYRQDLPRNVASCLREEFPNSKNFADGDIYRYRRQCQMEDDKAGAQKWLARLSKSKQADVIKLEKMAIRTDAMRKFKQALDSLLPFVGLWSTMEIGTLHRILSLRCPEEMTQYLTTIRVTWATIFLHDTDLASQLDAESVLLLQARFPALSLADHRFLESKWRTGRLFASIDNLEIRTRMWSQVCSLTCRIPTIHTFLEDTKYIEPCAQILKTLLPSKFEGSLKEAFSQCHTGGPIEVEFRSEGVYDSENSEAPAENLGSAYCQLWLFAMRHFPVLTNLKPRLNSRNHNVDPRGSFTLWQHRLGTLARRAGFESPEIIRLQELHPELETVRTFLREVRPLDVYNYDEISAAEIEQSLCSTLLRIQPRNIVGRRPELSGDFQNPMELKDRCGRPFERSFKRDEQYLFLGWIFCKDWEHLSAEQYHAFRKEEVSSFAIKREIFRAFFGETLSRIDLDEDNGHSQGEQHTTSSSPSNSIPSPDNQNSNFTANATLPHTPISQSRSIPQGVLQSSLVNATQSGQSLWNGRSVTQGSVSTRVRLHELTSLTPTGNSRVQRWVRRQGNIPENAKIAEVLAFYRQFPDSLKPLMIYQAQNRTFEIIPLSINLLQEYVVSMNQHSFWTAEDHEQWRATSIHDLYDSALDSGHVIVVTPIELPFQPPPFMLPLDNTEYESYNLNDLIFTGSRAEGLE